MAFYKRRGYAYNEEGKVFWEAPLAITVWTKKGPTVALAVEFWDDTLRIRQLQGVGGIWIPKDMQAWPELFVTACQLFVRRTGLKRIRLYRANQSLFYFFPDVHKIPREERTEAIKAIRARMRNRYDGTAESMGFTMQTRWGEWEPR